jgi:hypothetical protein
MSNFSPPAVREYFAFYSLIRKDTDMGVPDLESTQKCAPNDIYIVHFGQHLIYARNAPLLSPIAQHHNSPGPGIPVNIAMSWVGIFTHITMWVHGLVSKK